jgi:NAD+ kinase
MSSDDQMPRMPDARQPFLPGRVLLLRHPTPEAVALADDMAAFLTQRPGITIQHAAIEDPAAGADLSPRDLVIVLGGDGSMLRAGRLAARQRVPVLGVNLGRLGFLAEVQPDEWRETLGRVLAGDFWIEERMLLRVEHRRNDQPLQVFRVLNEAVVGRGALARPVRLKAMIDGGELTTYVADGLIISTPTGSTAYALAAGGPILPPELRNILLIAIAPHLSLERAIVLPQGAEVSVTVYTDHEAILSADGQVETPLQSGDHIGVRTSDQLARFIRVRPPTYFYASLMARMTQNPSANRGR